MHFSENQIYLGERSSHLREDLANRHDRIAIRVFLYFAMFAFGSVCGNCWGSIARAQEMHEVSESTRVDAALESHEVSPLQLAYALDVARTSVNEASLSARTRDVDLTYEASRFNGRDDATRLAWLRRHSACTNVGDCNRDGVVDERDDRAAERRPGNARWTRYLEWNDDEPDNFVGVWHPLWWARVRERALRRVLANTPTGVCGMQVRTWGRRSDFVARIDLVPVECGARNLGGTTPSIYRRAMERRRVREATADALALARDSS